MLNPIAFIYARIDLSVVGEHDQPGWDEASALEEKHSKSFRDEGTHDYAVWEIAAKKLHHIRINVEITRKTTCEIVNFGS